MYTKIELQPTRITSSKEHKHILNVQALGKRQITEIISMAALF